MHFTRSPQHQFRFYSSKGAWPKSSARGWDHGHRLSVESSLSDGGLFDYYDFFVHVSQPGWQVLEN